MADTKIVIEPMDGVALAEHEGAKTFNQQLYDALSDVEIGNGFAAPIPADKERKKLIHAFRVFITGKEVQATMLPHKIDTGKVVLKRTA